MCIFLLYFIIYIYIYFVFIKLVSDDGLMIEGVNYITKWTRK